MSPPATAAGRRVREPQAPAVRVPRAGTGRSGLATRPVAVAGTLPPARRRPADTRRAEPPLARPSRQARAAAAALEQTLEPPRVARERPARRPGQAPRLAARIQPARLERIIRGRAWIPVLAAMLLVIVGVRVEVLKLGASVGSEVATATTLQSSNAVLRAQISALSDSGRIERLAAGYGMRMPNPLEVHFLQRSTGRDVAAAIRAITPPSRTAFLSDLAAEQQADASASGTPLAATVAPSQASSASSTAASQSSAATVGAPSAASATSAAATTTVNPSSSATPASGGASVSLPASSAANTATTQPASTGPQATSSTGAPATSASTNGAAGLAG